MGDFSSSASKFETDTCIICCSHNNDDKLVTVTFKLDTIRASAVIRDETDLVDYLDANSNAVHQVHANCRRRFNRREDLEKIQKAKIEMARTGRTLAEVCEKRKDDWADEVKGRMQFCNDLMAADAVYHVKCHRRFSLMLEMTAGQAKRGRPLNVTADIAFEKLCTELEKSSERGIYTLQDLHMMMKCYMSVDKPDEEYVEGEMDDDDEETGQDSNNNDVYSTFYVKKRLLQKYDNHIQFAEIKGRKNVVCFKDFVIHIVSDEWYEEQYKQEGSKGEKLVKSAAALIRAQLRELEFDVTNYPSSDNILLDDESVIPPLLKLFLDCLINDKLKQASPAQCIVQASRPRTSILPIPFSLGVNLDRYGSSELIMELLRLGFCISYDELTRFKQYVVHNSCAIPIHGSSAEPTFAQFVADNVDHNVRTLDGMGTLHAMGLISAGVFPAGHFANVSRKIPRLQKRLLTSEICKEDTMCIATYGKNPGSALATLTLVDYASLLKPITLPAAVNISLLWGVELLMKCWMTLDRILHERLRIIKKT
jgi:hypothetical protein